MKFITTGICDEGAGLVAVVYNHNDNLACNLVPHTKLHVFNLPQLI